MQVAGLKLPHHGTLSGLPGSALATTCSRRSLSRPCMAWLPIRWTCPLASAGFGVWRGESRTEYDNCCPSSYSMSTIIRHCSNMSQWSSLAWSQCLCGDHVRCEGTRLNWEDLLVRIALWEVLSKNYKINKCSTAAMEKKTTNTRAMRRGQSSHFFSAVRIQKEE